MWQPCPRVGRVGSLYQVFSKDGLFNGGAKAYSGAIAITATTVAVEFVLLVDSTQVDSCTVAVVADGADGRPGLDGNPGKDGLAGCIQRLSEWAEGSIIAMTRR